MRVLVGRLPKTVGRWPRCVVSCLPFISPSLARPGHSFAPFFCQHPTALPAPPSQLSPAPPPACSCSAACPSWTGAAPAAGSSSCWCSRCTPSSPGGRGGSSASEVATIGQERHMLGREVVCGPVARLCTAPAACPQTPRRLRPTSMLERQCQERLSRYILATLRQQLRYLQR